MEYIYGALLLHTAGQPINEENLTKVLTSANVKVNEAMVKAVVAALEGVNIDEILKNAATAQIASQPSVQVAQPAQSKEEKKEKKKKEEEKASEEDAAAGLAALFG